MRRWMWLVGVVGLLVAHVPAATVLSEEQGGRAEETVWVFKEIATNTSPPGPGVVVNRFFDGFSRDFTDEPTAEFVVDFEEMLVPTVQRGANHSFTVKVRGRIAPGADDTVQGFRVTDAILIRSGVWPPYRPAVGVGVNCVTDIFGNPLGCTPPQGQWAENETTFTVGFPFGIPDDGLFRFGVSALNCPECFVEYVYEAKTVDPNAPRCFGSVATVGDPNGDGLFVGTRGDDVMIGTSAPEQFVGNGGNDKICARGGEDRVRVGTGSSQVDGGTSGGDVVAFTDAVTVSFRYGVGKAQTAAGTTTHQNFEIFVGSPEADTFLRPITEREVIYAGRAGRDTIDFSKVSGITPSSPGVSSRAGPSGSVRFVTDLGAAATLDIERVIGSSLADNFEAALPWTYGGRGRDVIHLRRGERGFGGAGKDILFLTEVGARRAEGGPGVDGLAFRDEAFPDGVAVDLIDLRAGPRVGPGKGATTALRTIEVVAGTDARDVIRGSASKDVLSGRGGPDILDGRRGDDVLRGGPNSDVLRGGLGDDNIDGGTGPRDMAVFTRAPAAVRLNLLLGTATIGRSTDTIKNVENVLGTRGDDDITGDRESNVIKGGAGNDVLRGGPGLDWLFGEAGVDEADGGRGIDVCVAEIEVRCEA